MTDVMQANEWELSRRKYRRMKIEIPVLFSWPNSPRITANGLTRDVSSSGIFIITNSAPPLGSLVKLVVLVRRSGALASDLRITTSGRVLRIETASAEDGTYGFAVQTRSRLALSKVKRVA